MSLSTEIAAEQRVAPRRRSRPGSVRWYLGHEIRLAWRDWIKPGREGRAAVGALIFLATMHLIGWQIAGALPDADAADPVTRRLADLLVGFGILSVFGMLVAQAMEVVTRAIYVRGDLELILSSPASVRRLFSIRMAASALSTLWLAGFLVLPVVDMLMIQRGWRWAGAHGVAIALAAAASAFALIVTYGLFRLVGPRRTRTLAQVVGAVIGAATVIGTQVPLILKSGDLSRLGLLHDPAFLAALPTPDSLVWLPVEAARGMPGPLAAVLGTSLGAFALAVWFVSRHFVAMSLAAESMPRARPAPTGVLRFRPRLAPRAMLRGKELRLILRDPWLLSQSLMQLLYLIPPALLLWRNFGDGVGSLVVLVPVVVMAAAQLAGGLAWLALSAEDARDLIATAPISAATVIRTKIEAVLLAIGTVLAPFLIALTVASPWLGLVALGFGAAGVASNCMIQWLFRTEARRSQFRLRQRSSRLATFCETMVSIAWAGAAGLAGAASSLALFPAAIAVALVGLCALARR